MDRPQSRLQQWRHKLLKLAEIERPIHLLKVVLGYLLITTLGFLPILAAFLGTTMEHAITGKPVNEGNSFFGVLPWLSFYTLPAAFFLFIFWTIIAAKSISSFIRKKK